MILNKYWQHVCTGDKVELQSVDLNKHKVYLKGKLNGCDLDIFDDYWRPITEKEFINMENVNPTQESPLKATDNVNHPSHYNHGKYECIDVMVDVFGKQAVADFCKCNAFKYQWRAEQKNGKEDYEKAAWYIGKYLELINR